MNHGAKGKKASDKPKKLRDKMAAAYGEMISDSRRKISGEGSSCGKKSR